MTSTITTVPAGLLAAHEHAREELKRADTKAATLLSLVGAALAGIIALTGRPVSLPATIALWASAAPILASVLLLIWAIRPRLNDNPVPGTWIHAAQVSPQELLDVHTQAGETSGLIAAHDVCVLATIAHGKYRRIQQAVALLVTGLGVLAVALVLSAVIA